MTAWTLSAIAYEQVAHAREQLVAVATSIRQHDNFAAAEQISAVIRQLEAARRHIA